MRLLTFAAGATAALFWATAASAQGFYAGASGAATWLEDADNEGGGTSIESESDTGFGLSGFVGYGFASGFRVEGELAYRKNDLDKLSITNDGGVGVALGLGSLNGLQVDTSGDATSLTVMANVYYDIRTGTAFTPYLGAGLGLSRVELDADVQGVNIVDDKDTVFAYQLMAGVGYAVTPQLTLFAGYRFFATQDPEMEEAVTGGSFDTEYQTHNVEFGARFRF